MKKEIGNKDIIIIDEGSFIGINAICILDNALRKVADNDLKFGGFKIICCSDFNQLKCVGDTEIYKPESEEIIDTMIDHNIQLENELEGEIDIAKVEKDISDKQREQL